MNLVKGLFSGKKERAISYKEQGNGYFKSGNYDEAIQYYTSGIELFPVDENEKPAVIIDTSMLSSKSLLLLIISIHR